MENGVDSLFFSLASENRLGILHTLSAEALRMNEIARKIEITPTEASRQIQRLRNENLIQKMPDGEYTQTNYGKLVMHLFPSYNFIFTHKQYFLNHDIWRLPPQFISRLGELSQGTLCTDIAEIVNGVDRMMRSSEEYVLVITDQVLGSHRNVMDEQVSRGIKFKALIHERMVDPANRVATAENEERRVVSTIPGLFVATEKEALASFLSLEGKVSTSGFFGSDPRFMKWVNDLFFYYWDKTSGVYP